MGSEVLLVIEDPSIPFRVLLEEEHMQFAWRSFKIHCIRISSGRGKQGGFSEFYTKIGAQNFYGCKASNPTPWRAR